MCVRSTRRERDADRTNKSHFINIITAIYKTPAGVIKYIQTNKQNAKKKKRQKNQLYYYYCYRVNDIFAWCPRRFGNNNDCELNNIYFAPPNVRLSVNQKFYYFSQYILVHYNFVFFLIAPHITYVITCITSPSFRHKKIYNQIFKNYNYIGTQTRIILIIIGIWSIEVWIS